MTNYQIPISKLAITCSLLFSFLLLPVKAQLKGLNINAENISFEKEKGKIEAQGSAEVTYQGLFLRGQHLIYYTSAETFHADSGFRFFYEGITLEGEALDYTLVSKEGQASKIYFSYKGMYLGGEKASFNPDHFILRNAYFTTCDQAPPHYRVTALEINLYPKFGWLVAYWGFFWLGNFPLVPLPTYIYDFRAEQRGHENLPPYPEIGSNSEDGNYLIESLTWHLKRELSGTYSLGWAANKGLLLGLKANYLLDDHQDGDFRLAWNPINKLVGGLTHSLHFGEESASVESFVKLLPSFHLYHYQLDTTFSYHERINYQRVSYYPKLEWQSKENELWAGKAKMNFSLLAAMVAEENNIKLAEGGGKIKLTGQAKETSLGEFVPALTLDGLFYANGQKWLKPSFEMGLKKSLTPDLALRFNYLHYFFVEGQSPFLFENYRFSPSDQLLAELYLKHGDASGQISASYFLDNWTPEDIDYTLFFKLHCYNLSISYRSLRNEFTMGFSLASMR